MSQATPRIQVNTIKRIVCHRFDLDKTDMTSRRRPRYIAWPRQLAMMLTRELTALSLPRIGQLFGGRDHTTVYHAIKAVAGRNTKYGAHAQLVDDLRVAIQAAAVKEQNGSFREEISTALSPPSTLQTSKPC